MIGWAGHTQGGGVVSNVSGGLKDGVHTIVILLCVNKLAIIETGYLDIQQRIQTDNHAVLKTVKIWTGRSWVLPKHLLKMRRSNYPDNCLIIDINSMDSMTTMLKEGTLQIFFRFHRIAGFNVELNLEDRERGVHRGGGTRSQIP